MCVCLCSIKKRDESLYIKLISVLQGITYDHVELNVYLNGKNMHCPASGIRGTVFPAVYGKETFPQSTLVNEMLHLTWVQLPTHPSTELGNWVILSSLPLYSLC